MISSLEAAGHGRSDGSADHATRPQPHAILYDSDCGFCKWSLDKILAWDRRRRLRPVGIQSAEGRQLLSSVPDEDRLSSWHLVSPAGEVLSAGAAAPRLLELLPRGRPLSLLLGRFPGATNHAYRFVAANRPHLTRLLRIDPDRDLRRLEARRAPRTTNRL